MSYMVPVLLAVLVSTAAASGQGDNSVLSPLLTSTLANIKLEKRTARLQFAKHAHFCREAIPSEKQTVVEEKAMVKAMEEDIAINAKGVEEMLQSLAKPLKDVQNANGDVRAASWVRGFESAQYKTLKAVPETIESEEKTSQKEYDLLMDQMVQKTLEASHKQVGFGILIGRMKQKEEDSKAALKDANTMLAASEVRLKRLADKCDLQAKSFLSQQDERDVRIQVLESSLGVVSSENHVTAVKPSADIETVKHMKKKNAGYSKGSPLYNKQKELDKTPPAPQELPQSDSVQPLLAQLRLV